MRWPLVVTNALVLSAIAWMLNVGSEKQAAVLVPKRTLAAAGSDVTALESQAARAPTASNIAALATAYLDRDQSGLAAAVLDRASRDVREQPVLAQLSARTLFQRGRPREALALSLDTLQNCEARAKNACPAWLVAKMTRQVVFLKALEAAGIEDPSADPEATRAAYERSARDMRLVAMR
jgi:hypothetical protein